MPIEKNLTSENYYNANASLDNIQALKKRIDDTYAQAITINQAYWAEADIDTRFKVGDQSIYDDYYGNMPAFKRKGFTFNRIKRVCNLITGHQRRNRKSTVTAPVEHNDDKASTQWSKLLYHTMNGANADEMISEAFEHGGVTTGMSLLNVWIDYSKDPESGDIKLDHVPYNAFLIDPHFKKKDLTDCNYIWRRQWLTKEAVKGLVPDDMASEIDKMQPGGNRDGKFQFMAESYNYSMNTLLSYDEYWYRADREATFLVDPEYGLTKEWDREDEEGLAQYMASFPQLVLKKVRVPTVRLTLMVEGHVVHDGPNPLGIDRYPFIPFMGYYEPNIAYFPWRVQGVVRNLRDAQFLYNRRKVIELDILESQVNSGFKYKPTSLVNPRDIYLEGQGKGIAMKQEADMNDVQEIQPAAIPASMIELSKMLGEEIQQISGVNEELLGSATDDKAGVLSMLRQGAGLTTLQILFDQLDFSQKLLGEVFVEIIQKKYMPGKVMRILGEQPVEEFFSRTFLNYDIRIEEGINTTTQRQQQFVQLLHLHELGVPVPTETLINAATLQDKEELVMTIQAEQQKAEQKEQMQHEMQMALLQAQIKDLEGKTIANIGLGNERNSRINENAELSVERRAKAIEDISDAQLNRVKMLTELQDLDISRIQNLLNIAEALKFTEGDAAVAENAVAAPVAQTGQRVRSPNPQ